VDLNWLYNIEAEVVSYDALTMATLVVLAGIMLRFFLTSISSVFYALQMSSVNNLLALCVSILQLVFVKTVTPAAPEQGLVMLACAYAVLSNLPILVAGVIVFSTKLRRCVPGIRYIDKQHIQNVMGIGAVFFACQIFYMLIANTNEFLISNLFGPQYTTEYSFYHKLTSLISMAASLALTPIWSVVTKAMTEKNYAWLDRLYRKLKLAGILVIVAQFAFILIQQPVMDIWLREDSITVELPTALAFAFFGSAFVYSSILSTVVCGMARMKLQMICYFIGAILKFAMVYLLGPVFNDWTIVVWANGLILLPYCIAQQIDLNRTIKKMALTPLETPPEDGQAPEPQA
jgi:O-antigen/teichoic acid export membrane protein